MIGFNQQTIARRKLTMTIVVLILLASFFVLRAVPWPKDAVFQAMLGMASFSLVSFVAVMTFIKFFTRKKNKYLFIGSAFLGTAILEGYSLLTSSSVGATLWTTSRIFLSTFLLLSLKSWREGEGVQKALKPRVYISAVSSAVLIIAAVTLLQSFDPYWRFLIFRRPLEIPAALLFGIAAFGYWKKGYWKFKFFEFWFLLSLIAAFFAQIYMALSGQFTDAAFNTGYVLKILSYLFSLVGLFMSTYAAFEEIEAEKKIHAGHTSGAYYLKTEKS
ncbi:hypothetical protein A2115_01580 [Candidatus Woesebacteria bacterium GWA1_41_8]|uniref:Membrane-associated sensor domain-containing protein n=1 Tax=Candidatus Woesebacteria bacterium GWA1_41_8 TaxID=1802471 RepID=A0A1F7WH95_9BACT|nr:MAG: hypothetical protein A2115_01580 [Candidatus Woesebacteria bacterium GWA1_41_8]